MITRTDLAEAILESAIFLGRKHLAGRHDQSTHGHGTGVNPGALSDIPPKGAEISPQRGVEIAAGIAEEFGVESSKIKYAKGKYEFNVNDQHYEAAAIFNPRNGTVTLYDHSLETETGATRIAAHEIQHARYEKVTDVMMNERYKARNRGDLDEDGNIKPGKEKLYPAYSSLGNRVNLSGNMDQLPEEAQQLARDDGVSSYSKAYWDEWHTKGESFVGVSYNRAVNETLAEVASIRRGGMIPLGGSVSHSWTKLYDDMAAVHETTRRKPKPKVSAVEGKSVLTDLKAEGAFIVHLLRPYDVGDGDWISFVNDKGESIIAKRVEGESTGLKSFTLDEKALHWKAIDKTATKWEPEYSDSAIAALETDRREILAIVESGGQKALYIKSSIDWGAIIDEIEKYLEKIAPENWRDKFAPVLRGLMTEQGRRWAVVLGTKFNATNFFASDWFNNYTLKFAKPINDTTLEGLNGVLQQAQTEGWSNGETQKHITTLFEQWMHGEKTQADFSWYAERMPPHRTEMIARTETMRASNAGSHEMFTDWGVKKHEWLSTLDDRVREAHASVNGQTRAIDEPFDVGGEQLMYPGDPAGRPDNTINCRCTSLPVMED